MKDGIVFVQIIQEDVDDLGRVDIPATEQQLVDHLMNPDRDIAMDFSVRLALEIKRLQFELEGKH